MFDLVVTRPFSTYAAGDRIADDAAIAFALSDYPSNVVRVAAGTQLAEQAAKKSK